MAKRRKRTKSATRGRASSSRKKTKKTAKAAKKRKVRKVKRPAASPAPSGASASELVAERLKPAIAPPRRVPAAPAAKRAAVIRCVNSALDANVPGWNSDGRGDTRKMGADLGYNTKSMPAFLGVVAQCLDPPYKLAIDKMSMTACVNATVAELKYLVLQNTT